MFDGIKRFFDQFKPKPLHPTLQQLTALGYQTGDRVCGRLIPPREIAENTELRIKLRLKKAIDWTATLTPTGLDLTELVWVSSGELKDDGIQKYKLVEGKRFKDGLGWLSRHNAMGYGVYFHPNAGRTKASVEKCYAAFFESDEEPLDGQWETIKQFENLTGIAPSVVVKTRKSLHVYFAFEASDQQLDGWTEQIQRPLALAMKSDPAIQNPDRLMRLAGFNHVKYIDGKFDFVPCTLEVCNDNKYTREQVKDALAIALPEPYTELRFKFWVYLSNKAHKDLGIEIEPSIALTCPESELEELDRRWRRFIKLSRDKKNGKDVNPEEAFSLPRSKLPKVHQPYKYEGDVFEGNTDTILWSQYLYGYNPHGRGDWITAQDPLIPKSDRHLHSTDSLHINKVTGAIKSHRGSEPKDVYEAMKEIAEEAIWNRLTILSVAPWKTINTPRIDLEELPLKPGAIYIIKSAKGTHKTNALQPLIPKFKNVYAWFNRVALGREECHRIGINWKDDLPAFTGSMKVGFCSDSSHQFNPSLLRDNGLFLMDECDQVFEHNFGDTCNKDGKRPLILASLQAQLAAAVTGNGMALFMSADVTDRDVDYITALAPPGCPVRVIVNQYKPALGNIFFDRSNNPDGLVKDLLEKLEAGLPCFVIDDIKNGIGGCKSIAEFIRKAHPEWANDIVEINGDTSGDPLIIDYLKNINQASLKTKLLACSPSVVSGISIQNGHFTGVYGFSNGVLTVSQMSQAISRVRGAEIINLWVAKKGLLFAGDRSLFPEQIKAYYQRNYERNAKHILALGAKYDPLTDEWSSPHFELFCQNAAYRNNCMVNLRERMRLHLSAEGYMLSDKDFDSDDTVADGLKASWHGIEIKHAFDVAAANILSDEQLKQFNESAIRPTPEQLLDIEKTFLYKSFGAELVDSMVFKHSSGVILTGCAAMCLKDKRGAYRQKLEAFYLLQADEKEAVAKDLAGEQKQLENGTRFAGDIKWRTRQRKCRIFLGLDKFLDPNAIFNPDDYAQMFTKAKKHRAKVKDTLNLEVGNIGAGQLFGELMGMIGLELDKDWASERTANGKRYKLRKINAASWEYAQMYCRYKSGATAPVTAPSASAILSDPLVVDRPPVDSYSLDVVGGDLPQNDIQYEVEFKPISQKIDPEVSDEQVEDCIRILMMCDCPVTTKTVFEAFKTLPQRLKEAVWRELPQQWRERLRLLAESG